MQLSKFTDYAFRVLLLLADTRGLSRIDDLAKELDSSAHHLKKVVQRLSKTGFVKTLKGRSGGIALALPAEQINLGEVLLAMEENMNIVECFRSSDACPLFRRSCKLKGLLHEASLRFIEVLGEKSLADISLD